MSAPICIVGLGQAEAGDDGVGWLVIERLRAQAPPGIDLQCTSDPTTIVHCMRAARLVVLIDAVVGAPPGIVRALSLEELAVTRPISSHAIGVREAIALGHALYPKGATVKLVAVTIDLPTGPAHGVCPAVAATVSRAADVALSLSRAWPIIDASV